MAPGFYRPGMFDADAGSTGTDGVDAPAARVGIEDLLVRNHDFQWGYDLEVTVTVEDGRTVHDERYYLQPGETKSEFDALDPGAYEVRVVLDNRRTTTAHVEVDDSTDGVLVELGNGAVSVHDGLYD